MVPFSALLGGPRSENLRDAHPVGGAVVVDQRQQTEIFLRTPGASSCRHLG